MIDVLDWPEYRVRPEIRADYCRAYVVKPTPRSWHWLEFSFHVRSLVELRGVSVLIPNWFGDERETALFLLYRAIQANLFDLDELGELRQVSGKSAKALLFNVFVVLEVSGVDQEKIIRRIHAV